MEKEIEKEKKQSRIVYHGGTALFQNFTKRKSDGCLGVYSIKNSFTAT